MAEDWISLREFARRRGVALSAVQKAIDSGRVTAVRRKSSGRLDAIEAIAAAVEWDANTDPTEAAKNGKILGQSNGPPIPTSLLAGLFPIGDGQGRTDNSAEAQAREASGGEATVPAAPGADKDPHGYYAARAERERINASQQQLDYLKALGVLVPKAEVMQLASRRYRAIRDRVLNIPDRVAAVLAAERDPAQVHALLTAELKRVLHELSDDARAEAARGTAERVAA